MSEGLIKQSNNIENVEAMRSDYLASSNPNETLQRFS